MTERYGFKRKRSLRRVLVPMLVAVLIVASAGLIHLLFKESKTPSETVTAVAIDPAEKIGVEIPKPEMRHLTPEDAHPSQEVPAKKAWVSQDPPSASKTVTTTWEERQEQQQTRKAEEHITQARESLRSGNLREARSQLDQARGLRPDLTEIAAIGKEIETAEAAAEKKRRDDEIRTRIQATPPEQDRAKHQTAIPPAGVKPGMPKSVYVAGVKIDLVYIPPGSFTMGSVRGEANEFPTHQVTITQGFWIGKTEVTQGQWRVIMGSNPSKFKKGDSYPVENVSWNDSQSFIRRLNQLGRGKKFRLPTEAEWEYACRADTRDERYGKVDAIAWYEANSKKSTQPVAQKSPNHFGLHDMLGNVWEWVECGPRVYTVIPATDPRSSISSDTRIARGGSWTDMQTTVRAAYREIFAPHIKSPDLGFRVVLED